MTQSFIRQTGLSSEPDCHRDWSVIGTGPSSELDCHRNWTAIGTGLPSGLARHRNWTVIGTGLSSGLVYHRDWTVIGTGLSSGLDRHRNWTVISTRESNDEDFLSLLQFLLKMGITALAMRNMTRLRFVPVTIRTEEIGDLIGSTEAASTNHNTAADGGSAI